MSGEFAVSFALKLNDQGSGPATQALAKISKGMKEVGETAKSTSSAAISAFQKLATSREILGIRSEKAIQNEIKQTEAAYQRMVNSGQAGARELGRAQDAMRQKVASLRQEMDGVKTSAGGMGKALGTAMGIVGAYQAGKMVLQGPVSRTMNYSTELAHASNVMFSGQSAAARIAAKPQINDAVMAGVREAKGGVSREDSLLGLKTLGASGEFGNDPHAAFAMLPTLTKAAAANNASVFDMANIAIKAKQTMGLTNTGRLLDIAAQGGIEGQFELRDMAKWLPQQMAYAKRVGLTGEHGFATLVAANQISMNTAASPDAAGNAVVNLLGKINSQDTANDAKKLGLDLSGTLAAAKAKGIDGLQAFLNLTEQVAAKDPRLVKLREQAKRAKGDDLKANLDAQIGIIEGSSIGKLVQDREASAFLVAGLNGRDRLNGIRDNSLSKRGVNDDLLKVIADEPGAKAQLAAAEAANNMQTALNNVNPLIGAAADAFSRLSQEYPTLSAAVTGSALATTALAASATAASVALALMAKSVPGAPALPGPGGTPGASPGGVGGIGAAGVRAAGLAGLPLAIMGGAAWAADWTEKPGNAEKVVGFGRGLLSPVGEFMSYLGFDKGGDIEARRSKNREGLDTSSSTPANQSITINIDGRTVAEIVNSHNGDIFQRH